MIGNAASSDRQWTLNRMIDRDLQSLAVELDWQRCPDGHELSLVRVDNDVHERPVGL